MSLNQDTSSSFSSSTLIDDFHALLAPKQGFGHWNPALSTWDSSNSSSIWSWTGVQCLRDRVISLDLTDLNLCGSASLDISQLDSLTHLSLAGSSFTSSIVITNLSSLEFLNISNNRFDAEFGWDFSSLANLEVLDTCNYLTAFLSVGLGLMDHVLLYAIPRGDNKSHLLLLSCVQENKYGYGGRSNRTDRIFLPILVSLVV
ncbi:hypothetical protein Ancab_002764 [Ancistrocladus abbreviatus]